MQQPSNEQKRAYLDYAATAPFDMRLHEAMIGCSWANASSLYTEGREAAKQLEDARKSIAKSLGAHAPSEIYFTSGGSEGDNTALRGMVNLVPGVKETHIVISAIEHHAVENAANSLKRDGYKVTVVPVDAAGSVQPKLLNDVLAHIEDAGNACALVAVQAVNNEIGSIQPIAQLAKIAHDHGALFFTDAVQGLGKVQINLEEWGVDAAAFSAHKVGGMKGCGVLYLRRGIRCTPLVYGGGQEMGLRSGTSNVLGAVTTAVAIKNAQDEREQNWERAVSFRKAIIDAISSCEAKNKLELTLPDANVAIDADPSHVPHIVPMLCSGLEGETMVLRLDIAGVAASAGSACSSGSLNPSPVLAAIHVPRDKAFNSLRISFGAQTTSADVERFIQVLPEVLR